MSLDLKRLKYRDPVLRDMFTALDVSLVVPIVFMVEGLQADAAKLRLAVLTVVAAAAGGATVGVVVSTKLVLVVVASVLGAGYLAQMGYALRRYRPTPVSSRPGTWLATTVSVVHFVTAINLIGHAELRKDLLTRIVVVALYIIHAIAGVAIVFMVTLSGPLNEAWGCYPPGNSLADFKFGPCGENPDLPWVNPNPQAVCRQPFVQDYTIAIRGPCESPTSGEQHFGPALALAAHAEAVGVAVYTIGCIHAYTIYFSDLKSPLPLRTPTSLFLQ
ncbi:MAG: hypothetical protein ACPGR8_01250 [Limisphaerales bacterium]